MRKTLIDYVEYDDLPEGFRVVAEVVGIGIARTLIERLGGISIFVPSLKRLSAAQLRYVADNPERNKIALAREMDVSSRHVEKLLKAVNQTETAE